MIDNVLVFIFAAATILMGKYALSLRAYLKELGRAYDEVTKGNYKVKINESFYGDLGKAGKSFNLMTKDIYKNIETLKDRNSELKAILKSISNAIVAIDKDQNILFMNRAAKNIFNYHEPDYEGKPFEMIAKNQKDLLLCILDLFHKRERAKTQLHLSNVDYKINLDPIRLDDNDKIVIGAIVNIEDITQRIKLETIRSDFVANVTHELKTPLTSINGFVETLKSNDEIDEETRMKFLNIIEAESNRLKTLIDDILILSFIEGNKNHYPNEMINLTHTINECLNLVSESIKDKNINIDFSVREDIYLKSNPELMKQLVLNLVDNAIKYSKEEGYVKLVMTEDEQKITLLVEDDGIGIPSEDIDRIFERFYRVDKARSKKVGGTGLGLAIVKHIVLNLNGNINVQSELNKGSKFIIEFPK